MKLIIAIATSGSISKAAKKLYKSQPNVSKELMALEEKYNTKLFERTHAGVKITQIGEAFLRSAFNILEEISTLERLQGGNDISPIHIHIGSVKLFYCLKGIQEWVDSQLRNENFSIFVHEHSSLEIIEKVATGEYELGYISVPEKYENQIKQTLQISNISCDQMLSYKKQLLLRKDHPYSEKAVIDLDALADYPEITMNLNVMFEEDKNATQISGKKVMVDGIGSVREYMNAVKGAYVWIAPISRQILEENGMHVKASNPESQTMKDFIIYRESSKTHPLTTSFRESMFHFIENMKDSWSGTL